MSAAPKGPLPRLVLLTNRKAAATRGRGLVETVTAAVQAGLRCVVLREKDLPVNERAELARELVPLLHAVGGILLVASDRDLADRVGADGVHLAASDALWDVGAGLVGRSCHNAVELKQAETDGVDYAFVSPVFATLSKPEYGPPLRTDGLLQLATAVDIPIYALGGITPNNAGDCLPAGAAGIAVMGAVMGANDPAAVTAALLAAIESVV